MEVADELDVSAVICIYNGQDALPAVFERLIAMKLNRFEVILVEDGSTDGSFELLSDFRSRNPSVRVFRNDANLGVSASRNRGIAAATRRFVWVADVDDDWDVNILDELTTAANRFGADAAICGAALVTNDTVGKVIGGGLTPGVVSGDRAVVLALSGAIRGYTWNKLIARDILIRAPFAPVRMYTDFSAVLTALHLCRSIALLDAVLYRHHANPGSLSRGKSNDIAALRTCRDTAVDIAGRVAEVQARPGLIEFFEAWFLLIPMASASAAGTSGELEPYSGIREAGRGLRHNGLRTLFTFSPTTWARAMAIVVLGRHYRWLYLCARSARHQTVRWRAHRQDPTAPPGRAGSTPVSYSGIQPLEDSSHPGGSRSGVA